MIAPFTPEEKSVINDFTQFDIFTRSKEFARLPLPEKEKLLNDSLQRTWQTLSPLSDAQERYNNMVENLYYKVMPRIYHGKDVDYSQGRIRTAFNNLVRGFVNDSLLSVGKTFGVIWDKHKEEPDNFLYNISTAAENWIDETFKDNPDLVATSGISRGVGQVAGLLIPGKIATTATKAGLYASGAANMSRLAMSLTEAKDFARAGQAMAIAQKMQQASQAGYNVARLQAMTQVAGMTFDEARELGLDAGLDPREATERALRVVPLATALNMMPIEKIFKAYRVIKDKDTVADLLIKTGVRDKFMPLFAKRAVAGLLKNVEIGVAEGVTEALESVIRSPLVINEPAPWSELLADGALGAAVGLIVGSPTTLRGVLPNRRRVTYEQALADLDNISAVLDGYQDKLSPYQKEVRKILNAALEQEAVSPEFIRGFLNVELVNTPQESDQPQRTGTHGEMSQVFRDSSAFIRKAAERAAKMDETQAERQDVAQSETQDIQTEQAVSEQVVTEQQTEQAVEQVADTLAQPQQTQVGQEGEVMTNEAQQQNIPQGETGEQAAPAEQTQEQETLETTQKTTEKESIDARGGSLRTQIVTPDNSMRLEGEYQIVGVDTLKAADGELQPRDRQRSSSDIQIESIARNFNPELMRPDINVSDGGAPVVGDDNVIESGNGRVMAIKRMRDNYPESYQKYLQSIKDFAQQRGIVFPENVDTPVLIRRRITPLAGDERKRFVRISNKDSKLAMTAVEQAVADAQMIDSELISLFDGDVEGGVLAAANAEFVRQFISRVASANEVNTFYDEQTKNLSQEGQKRVNAAILAYAYKDRNFLSKALESTNDDTANVTQGLVRSAPAMAALRGDVQIGKLPQSLSILQDVIDAYNTFRAAKSAEMTLVDYVSTDDMFAKIPPFVRRVSMALTHKMQGIKSANPAKIARIFKTYYEKTQDIDVRQTDTGSSNVPTKEELFEQALLGDQMLLFDDGQSSSAPTTRKKDKLRVAYVAGINEAGDAILQNLDGTELAKFPEDVAAKIVIEAAEKALLQEDKMAQTATSEEDAAALGARTLEAFIKEEVEQIDPVSYTHLTLPTIYSV